MREESSLDSSQRGSDAPARLGALAEAELDDVVRRLTGRPELSIRDWRWRPLHGGHGVPTGGVYRLWGTGHDQAGDHPWSVVAKLARPAGSAAHDPAHHYYWRREWFVFTVPDAVLPTQADELAAPCCFGQGGDSEGYWLWLEHIVETVECPWTLATYGLAARHLGMYNGRFLVDRPLPRNPWLASGVLRSYVDGYEPQWARLAGLPDSPLARKGWPPDQVRRMRVLWGKREALLAAESWLPRTACHGDPGDANLLARTRPDGVEQTVAIDWAFAGIGALGQDLATVLRSGMHADEDGYFAALDGAVYAGYLEGLRAVGWDGDPRLVRLGFTVAAALRYALNPVIGMAAAFTDDGHRRTLEQTFGVPLEAHVDGVVRLRNYCLVLANEAQDLWRVLAGSGDASRLRT